MTAARSSIPARAPLRFNPFGATTTSSRGWKAPSRVRSWDTNRLWSSSRPMAMAKWTAKRFSRSNGTSSRKRRTSSRACSSLVKLRTVTFLSRLSKSRKGPSSWTQTILWPGRGCISTWRSWTCVPHPTRNWRPGILNADGKCRSYLTDHHHTGDGPYQESGHRRLRRAHLLWRSRRYQTVLQGRSGGGARRHLGSHRRGGWRLNDGDTGHGAGRTQDSHSHRPLHG